MTQLFNVKILVLGSKCVGKSAITVRFLTKRYIGEYKSNSDWLYQQTVKTEEGMANIELLDVSRSWKEENTRYEIKDQIEWAEAYVVIYSICDRHSFSRAQEFLKTIISTRAPVYLPIILIANKKDLEVGRQVYLKEGRSLALQFGCQFNEISAADSNSEVCMAFESLLREVRLIQTKSQTTQNNNNNRNSNHRKLSIITVSRVFSAMFGKNHTNTSDDNNNNHNSPNGHKNNNNSSNSKRKNTVVMIPVVRKATKPTISL